VVVFYFVTYEVFISNKQPFLKNKRHAFIFIENPKNPINRKKKSICPLKNIYILFKNNFRNLINQIPT
jgi:hypothetical protein